MAEDTLDPNTLSPDERRRLLSKLLQRKSAAADKPAATPAPPSSGEGPATVAEGIAEIERLKTWMKALGEENPFFRPLDGVARPVVSAEGREVVNYACYNYVGLSGDPRVTRAAQDAAEQLGTSVGASRVASGERHLHRRLEAKMAEFFGVDDSLAFVGGYGANETVIGHVVGPRDLIVHDALMHRSGIAGAQLSGARRVAFPHNDFAALDQLLTEQRSGYRQCLILVEGLYSMDGDTVDLQALVEIKKRHDAMLFVDEAHASGVLGATGRGIAEHRDVDPTEVDFWMTTLSKTFASCGGVIAGSAQTIDYLRYSTPGFLFSVGMSPANTAAALEAATILMAEPDRTARLRDNSRLFHDLARESGLDTGPCEGYAVIPIITRSSEKALRLSNALFREGINVQPIFYPAVEESGARLRFFVTSEHSETQIRSTVDLVRRLLNTL